MNHPGERLVQGVGLTVWECHQFAAATQVEGLESSAATNACQKNPNESALHYIPKHSESSP